MSWARRARTQARAGAAPPAGTPPLSNSTVPAAPDAGKARDAGLRVRDAGRKVPGTAWCSLFCLPPVSPKVFPRCPLQRPGQPHGARLPLVSAPLLRPPACGTRQSTFPPEKVVAPGWALPSYPWGSFLLSPPRAAAGRRPHPIPGVPRTPWRGGAGRQVQGWQAPTAQGSARPQSGPLLPWPSDGSPEASSSTSVGQRRARGSLCLQKGAGRAGALGLMALPLCGQPARLRKWCLRPLGTRALHSLPPERGRCSGRTQATSAF